MEKSVLDKKKCDKHEHERGAKEGFSEPQIRRTNINVQFLIHIFCRHYIWVPILLPITERKINSFVINHLSYFV